jgi:hypothetical protein
MPAEAARPLEEADETVIPRGGLDLERHRRSREGHTARSPHHAAQDVGDGQHAISVELGDEAPADDLPGLAAEQGGGGAVHGHDPSRLIQGDDAGIESVQSGFGADGPLGLRGPGKAFRRQGGRRIGLLDRAEDQAGRGLARPDAGSAQDFDRLRMPSRA